MEITIKEYLWKKSPTQDPVSRAECLRCFKKYTGLSPYKYLQKYRLQAAAAFLETTDKSITDIAMQVQFPSSSAFISAFRKSIRQ